MHCIAPQLLSMLILMLQADPHDKIIGTWKSVDKDIGFHEILEFAVDGSYSQRITTEGTGTYTVRENRIYFESEMAGTEIYEFRIEQNILLMDTPKGKEKLTRLGEASAGSPLIVGEWGETKAIGNERITMEFRKDGRFRSFIETEPKRGSYNISRNLLSANVEGESSTIKFQIKKELLIVYAPTGQSRYRKLK